MSLNTYNVNLKPVLTSFVLEGFNTSNNSKICKTSLDVKMVGGLVFSQGLNFYLISITLVLATSISTSFS